MKTTRLLYILVFNLLIALTVSCSKDDNENSGDLVGLWHYVSLTSDISNPVNKELEELEKSMTALAGAFLSGTTLEFQANGTFTMRAMGESFSGTWKQEGGYFSMATDEEEYNENSLLTSGGSVTIKDGVLTLISNNLDEIDENTGKTYRAEGFTKYDVKLSFKK